MISVLCCIQARAGSNRLPGKVLKEICGKSIIRHIIERIKYCKNIDKIVLATSKNKENDALEAVARDQNISFFRGSEDDVLSRFIAVIDKFNPRHIVRICADSPLIDPQEIDKIVSHHINTGADYSFNHIPRMNNNYPDGIGAEIFKSNILSELNHKSLSSEEKEHINLFIWNNLEQYKVETLKAPEEIAYSELKFEVNTEKDFLFINKIFENIYKGDVFYTKDIIHYLKRVHKIK